MVAWQRQNTGLKLPKNKFSEMIRDVWKDLKLDIIQNGFRKAVIYPFKDDVIPKEKFHSDAWKRWQFAKDPVDRSTAAPEDKDVVENENATLLEASPSNNASLEVEPTNFPFQYLLLDTVKQQAHSSQKKKGRVAKGAEVITLIEATERVTVESIKKQKDCKKKKKINTKISSSDSERENGEMDEIYQDYDEDIDFLESNPLDKKDTINSPIEVNSWVLLKYCPKNYLNTM